MIRMIQCYNTMENSAMLAEPQDAASKRKKNKCSSYGCKNKRGEEKRGEVFTFRRPKVGIHLQQVTLTFFANLSTLK